MKRFLIKVLTKALGLLVEVDPRLKRAKELVVWANQQFVGKSGERKRAQVLSRLADENPDARLRELSFLIEQALKEIG